MEWFGQLFWGLLLGLWLVALLFSASLLAGSVGMSIESQLWKLTQLRNGKELTTTSFAFVLLKAIGLAIVHKQIK